LKISGKLDKALQALSPQEAGVLLSQLEGYEEMPVSIETFVLDPYFLGNTFEHTGFYPFWMNKLRELYPHAVLPSSYYECVVTGSIGTGKTTFAIVATLYSIYRLILLDDPQQRYNLTSSTDIRFALFNASLDLVYDVLWTIIHNMMSDSPFFRGISVADDAKKAEVVLPKRVGLTMASQVKHTLGKAIFGGILDETNFTRTISSGNKRVYEAYSSWLRRMESRFIREGGIIPGQLFLVSSKRDESDFLDAHIETLRRVQLEGRVRSSLVIDSCIWEVRKDVVNPTTGNKIYSGDFFPIFLGSQSEPPIIIDPKDRSRYQESMVIDVPVEHRDAFDKNIIDSIRDIAGVSTISRFKFIVNTNLLNESFKIVHAARDGYIKLSFDDDDQLMDYVNHDILLTYLQKTPSAKRVIHLDIGLTGDAYGFAMGCISGLKTISRSSMIDVDTEIQSVEPNITIELALGIMRGGSFQVPLFKIRKFILDLSNMGFPIGMITADSYESTDTLQLMKRINFETKVQSVDKTKGPYISLRNAIYEGRIQMPSNSILMRELDNLRESKKKIDHTEDGCLHPNTLIPLLDGRNVTIKELADNYNPDEPIYIYTVGESGIQPGIAINPRMTKRNAETVIVVLDNDKEVCCTPDHRFMMRDGTYKEAQDLVLNDSLMPLYRKLSKKGLVGYELFYDPIKERNHYTHRMVMKYILGIKTFPRGYVIHHKKAVNNNDPRELELVSRSEHIRIHSELQTGATSSEVREKKSRTTKEYWKTIKENAVLGDEYSIERIKKNRNIGIQNNIRGRNKIEENKIRRDAYVSIDLIKYEVPNSSSVSNLCDRLGINDHTLDKRLKDNNYTYDDLAGWFGCDNFEELRDLVFKTRSLCPSTETRNKMSLYRQNRLSSPDYKRRIEEKKNASIIDPDKLCRAAMECTSLTKLYRLLGINDRILSWTLEKFEISYEEFLSIMPLSNISRVKLQNHKVIEVKIGPIIDTYDISVPGTENFALSSGVFVHNSKDIADSIAAITYTLLELFHSQAIEYFSEYNERVSEQFRKVARYEEMELDLSYDDYGLTNFEERFGVDLDPYVTTRSL